MLAQKEERCSFSPQPSPHRYHDPNISPPPYSSSVRYMYSTVYYLEDGAHALATCRILPFQMKKALETVRRGPSGATKAAAVAEEARLLSLCIFRAFPSVNMSNLLSVFF